MKRPFAGGPAFFLLSPAIAPPLKLVVVLSAFLLASEAGAGEDGQAAPQEVQAQEDIDAAEVARMTAVLHSQVVNARVWLWTWASVYGAISLTETVINASSTGGSQTSAQVNIATSTFGFFATVVFPPPVAFDWDPVARMPEETDVQRAAKAVAVRALFAREVSRERFRHSVWGHLLGFGFNAIVCSYMYFALHLGSRAVLNFLLGSAFWEANIWTSPNASMQLADEFRAQAQAQLPLQVVPVALGTSGAGFALVGRF